MMKHGGRFLSPCSFFAKQLKSTDHTDDTDFLRWCFGKGHTEINHRNLDGIYTDFFKVTQKSQKFLSTDHTENTLSLQKNATQSHKC